MLAAILVLAPLRVASVAAQGVEANGTESGAALRVFLIIMEPGDRLLSRFGHSSIWIQDAEARTSTAYSYGASDPGQPDFWRQVVQARVTSRLARSEAYELLLLTYADANRTVRIQELNLSPSQRVALRDLLNRDL